MEKTIIGTKKDSPNNKPPRVGAIAPEMRVKAEAVPIPVARKVVGYASGVSAYNAPQAPRAKNDIHTPIKTMNDNEFAAANRYVKMPLSSRYMASVFFLPHFSTRYAAEK